jgi:hypothetical protein
MNKFFKKAINSRNMLLLAFFMAILWQVTNFSQFGIAYLKEFPEFVGNCAYPIMFLSMAGCFFVAFILWIEESISKSSNKFSI